MSALTWDQYGDRLYETGISKAVLYEPNGDGVAWNGLTSVEENFSNSVESVHYDGVKFNDIVTIGDFSAVLRAYTYPDEFLQYEGTLQDQSGFYIYDQPKKQFCLSYQSLIGDDIRGLRAGYKIHLIYNATAVPSQVNYQTLTTDSEPIEFEWSITTIPEELANFRPTAHVVLDSRKIDKNLLRDVEDILYGTEEHNAHLPSLKSLSTFLRKWNRFIVTDHGDGTWSAESPIEGVVTMLDSDTFQIVSDTANYLDAFSYEISSSAKDEEEIWGL